MATSLSLSVIFRRSIFYNNSLFRKVKFYDKNKRVVDPSKFYVPKGICKKPDDTYHYHLFQQKGKMKETLTSILAGKHIVKGFYRTWSNKKIRRVWKPNIQTFNIYSKILDEHFRIRMSTYALRQMEKCGDFDSYILNTAPWHLMSLIGERLRTAMHLKLIEWGKKKKLNKKFSEWCIKFDQEIQKQKDANQIPDIELAAKNTGIIFNPQLIEEYNQQYQTLINSLKILPDK